CGCFGLTCLLGAVQAEFLNPGDVKDRVAVKIIEEALESRALAEGGVVTEGSAGSTAISLATVAFAFGYTCHVVIPDDAAIEKALESGALAEGGVVTEGSAGSTASCNSSSCIWMYLLKNNGLFVGSSSAMNCVGAIRAARALGPGHTIVTILCDNGMRHLNRIHFHFLSPSEPPMRTTACAIVTALSIAVVVSYFLCKHTQKQYSRRRQTTSLKKSRNELVAATGCEILGKVEFLNPGGSVKDRVAVKIIEKWWELDAFVAAAGTGGTCCTIASVSCFLKEKNSNIKCFIVDPPGSGLFNNVTRGVMYTREEAEDRRLKNPFDTITKGIGINRLTENFKLAKLDGDFRNTHISARVITLMLLMLVRYLLKNDGLFVGSSSAMNCVGAVRVARALGPGHTIVTILCDSGMRHLIKFFDFEYLSQHGLTPSVTGLEFLGFN
ncbi:cysteine synthase 2-like, partial [Ipomoea triloba]|uniref:cysteine synthase 2-like n=1 Tax=Ipomoea triloba TaxID=35885 RepID=UPI00125E8936